MIQPIIISRSSTALIIHVSINEVSQIGTKIYLEPIIKVDAGQHNITYLFYVNWNILVDDIDNKMIT